jgi:uncharacterized membrane protein (Fun14 family)
MNNRNEEVISYIGIGICIGIAIGFVLKVFIDTYFIIENLP